MNQRDWTGVLPAITTPFLQDLSIDVDFLRRHVRWLLDAGCRGIVTPGSLGEGSTLSDVEKGLLWHECVAACTAASGNRPVIAAIAAASTGEAVRLAVAAKDAGCKGLMVLPPYVYKGCWREMKMHVGAVIRATDLSCMLYNNPIAYGTDFVPAQIAELAREHANLHAVKESSGDVRRIIAIRALLGDRLNVLVGMDDAVVESVRMGAVGWIAGLVNALPAESVRLFELACDGTKQDEAQALYAAFLPLLRMDTTYDFVQLIKLVQAEVGMIGSGGAVTRPPRLLPVGAELERVRDEIRREICRVVPGFSRR
jgi:1-pyrroline-4-hydroxy-2-carboxylate deaminase